MAGLESRGDNGRDNKAGTSSDKGLRKPSSLEIMIREKEQKRQKEEQERQQALRSEHQDRVESKRPNILTGDKMSSKSFIQKVEKREEIRKTILSSARFKKAFDGKKWKETSKKYIIDEYVKNNKDRIARLRGLAQTKPAQIYELTGLFGQSLESVFQDQEKAIDSLIPRFMQEGAKNRKEISDKLAVHSDYLELLEWRTMNHQDLKHTDIMSDEMRDKVYESVQEEHNYRSFFIMRELTDEKWRKIKFMLDCITTADTSPTAFATEHRRALMELEKQQKDKKSDFSKELEKYNSTETEYARESGLLEKQGSDLAPSEYKERAAGYVQTSKDIFEFEKTLRAKIASIEAEPESMSSDFMSNIGAIGPSNPEFWHKKPQVPQDNEIFSRNPHDTNEWWK